MIIQGETQVKDIFKRLEYIEFYVLSTYRDARELDNEKLNTDERLKLNEIRKLCVRLLKEFSEI